jgi:hypothetical protein
MKEKEALPGGIVLSREKGMYGEVNGFDSAPT